MRNSALLFIISVAAVVGLGTGRASAQGLDTNLLHALMSCSAVMETAADLDNVNPTESFELGQHGIVLETESDILMINAAVPSERRSQIWEAYRADAAAASTSNPQGFWGVVDACFANPDVANALEF